MLPYPKQQIVDHINIHLEQMIYQLRTDAELSICLRLELEHFYTTEAYLRRRRTGGTTEAEDFIYDWQKKELPSQTRPRHLARNRREQTGDESTVSRRNQ